MAGTRLGVNDLRRLSRPENFRTRQRTDDVLSEDPAQSQDSSSLNTGKIDAAARNFFPSPSVSTPSPPGDQRVRLSGRPPSSSLRLSMLSSANSARSTPKNSPNFQDSAQSRLLQQHSSTPISESKEKHPALTSIQLGRAVQTERYWKNLQKYHTLRHMKSMPVEVKRPIIKEVMIAKILERIWRTRGRTASRELREARKEKYFADYERSELAENRRDDDLSCSVAQRIRQDLEPYLGGLSSITNNAVTASVF